MLYKNITFVWKAVYSKEPVGAQIEHKVAERHIYGSSRPGMNVSEVEMIGATVPTEEFDFSIGDKQYECSNHLGNVLAVITDKKYARDDNTDLIIDYFQPEVISSQDYSPFGVLLEERNWSSDQYRYLFQGQENDSEIKGNGNSYNYTFRMHDSRLGRFLSLDPKGGKYAWNSAYAYSANRVIDAFELEGLEYISVDTWYDYIATGEVQLDNSTWFLYEWVEFNGTYYANIGQHLYDKDGEQITEWVYTDIMLFDDDSDDPFIFWDERLPSDENDNCACLANAQAEDLGTTLKEGEVSYAEGSVIEVYNAETNEGLNLDDAIDYINRQLEADKVVVVGVDYEPGGTDFLGTNHYIVVVGRKQVNGENRFLFLENATIYKANAKDFDQNYLVPGTGDSGLGGQSAWGSGFEATRVQINQEQE